MADRRFYGTAEASRILRVPPHRLRLWARRLGLEPARTPGGRRKFRPEDLRLLARAADLLAKGHTLPAVRRRLCEPLQLELPLERPEREALRRVRRELERLRELLG